MPVAALGKERLYAGLLVERLHNKGSYYSFPVAIFSKIEESTKKSGKTIDKRGKEAYNIIG